MKQTSNFLPFDVHLSQDIIVLYIYETSIGIARQYYYFDSSIISLIALILAVFFFLIIIFYPIFNIYEIKIGYVGNEKNSNIQNNVSHQKIANNLINNIFSMIDDSSIYRYQELLAMVSGDEQTAERLINLEASKHPEKMRREVIDIAISKLLRDRH